MQVKEKEITLSTSAVVFNYLFIFFVCVFVNCCSFQRYFQNVWSWQYCGLACLVIVLLPCLLTQIIVLIGGSCFRRVNMSQRKWLSYH